MTKEIKYGQRIDSFTDRHHHYRTNLLAGLVGIVLFTVAAAIRPDFRNHSDLPVIAFGEYPLNQKIPIVPLARSIRESAYVVLRQ
jgi:hypothetical protein